MSDLEQFFKTINDSETMILATSDKEVTMRTVSPVYYNKSILIFTNENTVKYKQLKKNNNCCINIGPYFAQCKVDFLGKTMLEKNEELRNEYSKKYNDAFLENVPNGGRESEFLLLKPYLITGWIKKTNTQTNIEELEPIEIKIN